MIRTAPLNDLDALVGIENRSFVTDRLSRRSFRYLLTRGNAVTLVDEAQGVIRGYIILLFNIGTSLARMYSFAIDPPHRGRGVAKTLIAAAEATTLEHDCVSLRLE